MKQILILLLLFTPLLNQAKTADFYNNSSFDKFDPKDSIIQPEIAVNEISFIDGKKMVLKKSLKEKICGTISEELCNCIVVAISKVYTFSEFTSFLGLDSEEAALELLQNTEFEAVLAGYIDDPNMFNETGRFTVSAKTQEIQCKRDFKKMMSTTEFNIFEKKVNIDGLCRCYVEKTSEFTLKEMSVMNDKIQRKVSEYMDYCILENLKENKNIISEDYYTPLSYTAKDYFERALNRSTRQDYYGAIIDYTKAIEIHPDYADAYSKRGSAKYYLENLSGACADWIKAADLGDEDAAELVRDKCN